jgi:hypothetical protein
MNSQRQCSIDFHSKLPSILWRHFGDQLAHDLHLSFQCPSRRLIGPGELHRVARRRRLVRRGRRGRVGVAAAEDRGKGAFPKGLFLGCRGNTGSSPGRKMKIVATFLQKLDI